MLADVQKNKDNKLFCNKLFMPLRTIESVLLLHLSLCNPRTEFFLCFSKITSKEHKEGLGKEMKKCKQPPVLSK